MTRGIMDRMKIRSTVVAALLFGLGFGIVARPRGPVIAVIVAVLVAALVVGASALMARIRADQAAGSAAIAGWAQEHGWFYAPSDSSAGVDAPQPMEARFDDYMLATAGFPRETAFPQGPETRIVDSLASTVAGRPVRLAHQVRTRRSYGAKGQPMTSEDWTLVALIDGIAAGSTPPDPGELPGVGRVELCSGGGACTLLLCSPGRVGAERLERLDTMVDAVRRAIACGEGRSPSAR